MLKRLEDQDKKRVLEYLSAEPEINTYLIGSVESFDSKEEIQDVWLIEKNGLIDSILLRYIDSYIPYSASSNFDAQALGEKLTKDSARGISGKTTVINRIKSYVSGYEFEEMYLSKLDSVEVNANIGNLQRATLDDVDELMEFYFSIPEFSMASHKETSTAMTRDGIESGTGRYYFIKRGSRIVAAAGTSAENSMSAMLIAVATAKEYRNQGLATGVVAGLCKDLLQNGKKFVCLFYDDPTAGAIYRHIGFQEIGKWTLGSRKTMPLISRSVYP